MKLRSLLASCLAKTGTDVVFGLLGAGNMYIMHDMVKDCGVKYIPAAREDAAVLMAAAWARVTGKLGLATVTYGPGISNSVTALGECARGRTPMVILAGAERAMSRPMIWEALQTVDQEDMVRASGARYMRLRGPYSVVNDVVAAVRLALIEQAPVVLAVPQDLQEVEVDDAVPDSVMPNLLVPPPDPESLDRAVGIIASAARPIVLAGRGAVLADARQELVSLADRIGAPLATTLLAKDYFHGEPNNIGIFGGLGTPVSADQIAQSDCIIAMGASLNQLTTSDGSLMRGKTIVHCDHDRASIGRHQRVGCEVIGDVLTAAREINSMLDELPPRPSGARKAELERALAGFSWSSTFEDKSTSETVDLRTAMIRLDDILPADRSIVSDPGSVSFAALRYLSISDPRGMVPHRFGAVGVGLGLALGAAYAQPGRATVLAIGDGGFMMALNELNTAVQNDLDLIVLVLNNRSYGREVIRYEQAGMDTSLAYFSWPEFAPIAEAFGFRGITVRNLDGLESLRAAVATRDRPLLIDIKLDVTVPMGYSA